MNFFIASFLAVISLYSYSVRTLTGNLTALSAYQGKKILLVNVASKSGYHHQLQQLEQLQQQYKDSLVIIAFPSNSFGNEPLDSAGLRYLFQDSLKASFVVSRKTKVADYGLHPIYRWLSDSSLNGNATAFAINDDFQKVLISKEGKPYGYFNSMVSPLDSLITSAIEKP